MYLILQIVAISSQLDQHLSVKHLFYPCSPPYFVRDIMEDDHGMVLLGFCVIMFQENSHTQSE